MTVEPFSTFGAPLAIEPPATFVMPGAIGFTRTSPAEGMDEPKDCQCRVGQRDKALGQAGALGVVSVFVSPEKAAPRRGKW
jgi:hypothetical protein